MENIFTIVVTYNGDAWIEKCMDSLLNSSVSTNIIVVDNQSSDNTVQILRLKYQHRVQLVLAGSNLGFGKANNLGIKRAIDQGAEYVFLLNQDAWVQTDTIETLHFVLRSNRMLGIVSPIHLTASGKSLDHHFYSYLYKSEIESFLTGVLIGKSFDQVYIETKFVNAAAWMLTRDCLLNVGGFDPFFFHYGEDRNLSQRAIYHGYRIGIIPNAFVFHDRESRRINQVKSLARRIEFDFMNFKVDACNIRRGNIHWFIVKRMMRYILSALVHLFSARLGEVIYSWKMFVCIFFNYPSIMQSRKRSFRGKLSVY